MLVRYKIWSNCSMPVRYTYRCQYLEKNNNKKERKNIIITADNNFFVCLFVTVRINSFLQNCCIICPSCLEPPAVNGKRVDGLVVERLIMCR